MNKVESIRKLNETELQLGIAGTRASWHQTYASCPFIYVGGLPTAFTEGDLLAMFEQYGIVVHVNLIRDADTGKSRGFAFLQYHDSRSAVLAVDNFTGAEVAGRTLRVDHAGNYSVPEEGRSTAIDTTPAQLREASTAHTTEGAGKRTVESAVTNGLVQEVPDAESRREKAVLARLRSMRRQREREERGQGDFDSEHPQRATEEDAVDSRKQVHEVPKDADGSPGNEAWKVPGARERIEKRKRKKEREERKAERARIRELRKQRRAEREKLS